MQKLYFILLNHQCKPNTKANILEASSIQAAGIVCKVHKTGWDDDKIACEIIASASKAFFYKKPKGTKHEMKYWTAADIEPRRH